MIHGSIEGFDGSVNSHLDADKNTHSQGDSYNGKNGSPFMKTKVAEGDVLEEVEEDHKLKIPACGRQANVKPHMSNECQSSKCVTQPFRVDITQG
jgi:hypothetical protein